ncbi:hypothetical protein SCLARK_00683 [Spiroplasma clarkii]|uniref:YdhG-like domain-containing protein n=1 Tax=Spiroplasma clarkii TaxID=2139 RepID=A0A1Y0L037_9MOLU|nr:YdeI/OmpD-associated family protein [Spiroplasma clarkii]ARU91341.1 hypothetical protein SCLARK_00683 [Spiroplasma clarkii]ATX70765.1 hypothetical protein SCLAR_v1c04410 [Spiroplasma clarkii]
MRTNPTVEEYINKLSKFQAEFKAMRALLMEFELDEEFKWWTPVYDYNGKNVVILGKFKTECVFSFVKGSLLKDPYQILQAPGPNAQGGKIIRFANVAEIEALADKIKEYIQEAIENERLGLKIVYKDYPLPDELVEILASNPELSVAWDKLTKGRQKGYVLYFSSAKQSATRIARIEKNIDKILAGKGMHD